MYLLNLTLGQFLVLFGSVTALMLALYLLDRARRRQVVSTLRFWVAAERPTAITRRRHIQQPLSLILQLLSMGLLLLAIAQLRWGPQAGAPRDHVVILDTSAWMSAKSGQKTLIEAARERARAYVRAVPARDRIMLVRADGLATPATPFEPDRKKLEAAIAESQPGSTALNLDEALAFARQIQNQGGRRGGEIVFIGAGRNAEGESAAVARPPLPNLRFIPVADAVENRGLRKVAVRRSTSDPDLWEIYVSVRNYGTVPQTVALSLRYGGSQGGAGSVPVGSQRLQLPPGGEREINFEYRTRAAGLLEARLLPRDGFPGDDRAVLELPRAESLQVTVYSDEPDLLRPMLSANPRLRAVFRKPAEYGAGAHAEDSLVILDRFRPAARPAVDSIWIDPPAEGSPIPVRARPVNVAFARWLSDHPLGAGLRTKDFRLESTSVFEAAPDDIKIGEVENGPVIVARPGKSKIVALGFHPALSAMRYELATPLLFANILRWMSPAVFRRWELSVGSVGTVKMTLDEDVKPSEIRVVHEDGKPAPFTIRDRSLEFFAGTRGTVRVIAADHEYVYSLTLPQLWESKWTPAPGARRGIPRFRDVGGDYIELWHWLALLGAAGLVVEWVLYGRFSRGLRRRAATAVSQRQAKVA